MKQIKVSEATNTQLDWLVAKCDGYRLDLVPEGEYSPTTDPAQMQPIMEREKIATDPRKGQWQATIWNEPRTQNPAYGPTMLIAAARCYVASKLGETVEVPEELS